MHRLAKFGLSKTVPVLKPVRAWWSRKRWLFSGLDRNALHKFDRRLYVLSVNIVDECLVQWSPFAACVLAIPTFVSQTMRLRQGPYNKLCEYDISSPLIMELPETCHNTPSPMLEKCQYY